MAQTKAQGIVLSALDLLIAAQAKAVGAILIPSDKAFFHLSGLIEIENWAIDIEAPPPAISGHKFLVL
jgi:predicted nucleic acid-binding protein